MALFRVTYLALEYMNKLNGGRGGVIVNTASMAGTRMHCNSDLKTRPRARAVFPFVQFVTVDLTLLIRKIQLFPFQDDGD